MTDGTSSRHRRVRSYVRREGRMTRGQQSALDRLWPRYGLDIETAFDAQRIFGRIAPLTLEIGFGNGANLTRMAAHDPGGDYLGIEVHRPGVGQLLRLVEEQALSNVRVFCHDAVEVLAETIPDAALTRVLLLFPDPWPKKKHHKRRIVQPDFIALLARRIAPGGELHLATDWQDYAEQMRAVLQAESAFTALSSAATADARVATRFETRGRRLGHRVTDLRYRRR